MKAWRRKRKKLVTLTPRQEIRQEIRWLVLPVIVESFFALAGSLIVLAFLNRIDSVGLSSLRHVSAYGLATILTGIVWNLLKGIGIGSTIAIARASGAGDDALIRRIGWQTAGFLGLLGAACGVLLFFLARPLMLFYRPDAATLEVAVSYIRICCFGFPFLGLLHASVGILQGMGNTRTPMKLSAILNLVFVVVGLPLMFGWFGRPQGTLGSAYALVCGQLVNAVVGLYLLFGRRGPLRPGLSEGAHRPSLPVLLNVLKLGLPTSVETVIWLLASMVLGRVMLGFGELAYAANQIAVQTETIASLPATSFGIVAMTLCGRAFGSGKPDLGARTLKEIRLSALPVVGAGMFLLMALPGLLMRLMTGNAEVIALGAVYLRIIGLCLFFLSTVQIDFGVLKSAGRTHAPMLVALGCIWLFRVPMSIFVASRPGATIHWMWYVMAVDLTLRALIAHLVLRRNKLFRPLAEEDEKKLVKRECS